MNSINVSISRQDNPTTSTLTIMSQFLNYFNVSGRHALIILAVAVSFFIGNGQSDLFDNSETHYTRVIQEMQSTGDYLTLHFNGEPWFVHPPLYFWMSSGLTTVFGWTPMILRLQEALFSLGILWLTYAIAVLFYSRIVALTSVLICGSSFYIIALGKLAIFDAHLYFFMMLSLFFILRAHVNDRISVRPMALAGIATALGILVKGPIALVQQLMVFGPFFIAIKQWRILLRPQIWFGIVLSIALVVPWYGHQLMVHGHEFFVGALKDYTWYRFFDVVENQTGPWYYYFFVLGAFFPWIGWLPQVMVQTIRNKIQINSSLERQGIVFAWLMIGITFIFFSVAKTKLPNYIYLVFPFLAMIFSHWVHQVKRKITIIVPLIITVLLVIIAGFSIQVYEISAEDQQLFKLLFIALSLPIVPFVISIAKQHSKVVSIGSYAAAMVVVIGWLSFSILPRVSNYDPIKPVANMILNDIGLYDVILVNDFKPSLMVRLNQNVTHINNQKALANFKHKDRPVYIILNEDDLMTQKIPNMLIDNQWAFPKKMLVRLIPKL